MTNEQTKAMHDASLKWNPDEPGFVARKDTWIDTIWVVSLEDSNLMGLLWKTPHDYWRIDWRMWYAKGDRKSWYIIEPFEKSGSEETRKRYANSFREVVSNQARVLGGDYTESVINSRGDKCLDKIVALVPGLEITVIP